MSDSHHDRTRSFLDRMLGAGLPAAAAATFRLHLERVMEGERGILPRGRIDPVESLPAADGFGSHAAAGRKALARCVILKLNGGLGTSMGLEHAKSLLTVRDGHSFLDLIARQVLALRTATGAPVPLVLMNSFRTDADSLAELARHPDLALPGLPLSFLQHKVPKVLADTLEPARHPTDPKLEWCPPGHGDLYTALKTSGVLERLLAQGAEWAFVSNADNLGAVLDPALLGYMVTRRLPFMMEVADRTAADRKGGHLCRLSDGRLALREAAQCPEDERDEFQDIALYRFFNTNNIWLHLPTLAALLTRSGGVLPLATIVNRKTLDPREADSPAVFQLETAMGSALSLFDGAAAVRVGRARFSPVKTTDDLLGVRSDAYHLTDDSRIVLAPERSNPPSIALDRRYYRLIDDFEPRFAAGPPSLVACDELTVEGDVTFAAHIVVEGRVTVRATTPARVGPGAVLRGEVEL